LAVLAVGCTHTWDDLTSRRFRREPFQTLFVSPEPMSVLRDPNATGDERVRAIQGLEEPIRNGGTPADQEEAIKILTETATGDKQGLARIAAIDALGRFEDPQVAEILISAYHSAQPTETAKTEADGTMRFVKPAGHSEPAAQRLFDPLAPTDPSAFPPEMVASIQCQALTALGKTRHPEALPLLADVAARPVGGEGDGDRLGSQQRRSVKMAAVRALGEFRAERRAAEPLVQVLAEPDIALRDEAHEGLIQITGHQLPADPGAWEPLLRSDIPFNPQEPGVIEQVGGWFEE
jgi:hypothetical protein